MEKQEEAMGQEAAGDPERPGLAWDSPQIGLVPWPPAVLFSVGGLSLITCVSKWPSSWSRLRDQMAPSLQMSAWMEPLLSWLLALHLSHRCSQPENSARTPSYLSQNPVNHRLELANSFFLSQAAPALSLL